MSVLIKGVVPDEFNAHKDSLAPHLEETLAVLFKGGKPCFVPLDGWSPGHTGSGAGGASPFYQYVATGVTANSKGRLYTTFYGFSGAIDNPGKADWSKRLYFILGYRRYLSDDEVVARIQIKQTSNFGALVNKGLGIRVDNLALKGESYGSSLGVVDLGVTVHSNVVNEIAIVHYGTKVEWYVGRQLRGTQNDTAKIPMGIPAPGSTRFVHTIINGPTGGINANSTLLHPSLWQEGENSIFEEDYLAGLFVNTVQGVATDGTYIYVSDSLGAPPPPGRLAKYTMDGVFVCELTTEDFGAHYYQDCNVIDGKLYVGLRYTPSTIRVYNLSDLSYTGEQHVLAEFGGGIESVSKYGGYFWVIWNTSKKVSQYDSSWNHIATYDLTFPIDGVYYYQGIAWKDNDIYVVVHGSSSPTPCVDRYRWTGTGFEEVKRYAPSAQHCNQGLCIHNNTMYIAERAVNRISIMSCPSD